MCIIQMQNSRQWHVYKYWNILHVISIEHVYTSVRVSLLDKNYFTFQRNNCCALFIQLDLQHVFF